MFGMHDVVWYDGEREREVTLQLTSAGLELSKFKSIRKDPWYTVLDVEAGGPDSLQKRITATRLLALGPLALAARKKTGEAFAYVDFKDGSQMVLKFDKMSEPQVRALFAPYRGSFAKPNQSGSPTVSELEAMDAADAAPKVDPLDRLKKLAELRDAGILTEDEFAAQKAKILQDLA